MRSLYHLLVLLATVNSALLDDDVTEYATKTVYVCPPVQGNRYGAIPRSLPRSLVTSIDIFNDFDVNDLLVRYYYDLSNYTNFNITASNYTTPNYNENITTANSPANSPATSCSGYNCSRPSHSALTTSLNLARRDNDNSEAYETKPVNTMRGELDDTITTDPELNRINNLMRGDGFMGALSVYSDVVRGVDTGDKSNKNLKLFDKIWDTMWSEFWKNNNQDGEEKVWRSKDSANILMMMTPNYYSIQTSDYEDSRKYLNDRFNDANAKKDNGIRKITKMDKDKLDFIADLVADDDTARSAYATYMMNVYYEYGVLYDCKEGDSSCRIIDGWGAVKDAEKKDYSAIVAVASSFKTLFGSGIPFSAIYMQAAAIPEAAAVPVSPSDITKEAGKESYSSVKETASSSSFYPSTAMTTASQCTALYASVYDRDVDERYDDEDSDVGMEPEVSDLNRTLYKRATAITKNKPRSLDQFCDHLDQSKYQACKEALDRHKVKINVNGPDITFNGAYNEFLDGKFDMWKRDANGLPNKLVAEDIPVYIVNAAGTSPGVACNAMKFIALQHTNPKYFGACRNKEKPAHNTAMMAFIRGTRYQRNQVYSSNCGDAANENARRSSEDTLVKLFDGYETKTGKSFEADEFPPSSANFLLEAEHIVTTCVPDYDNNMDGQLIAKFLNANGGTNDCLSLWRDSQKKCSLACYVRAVDSSGPRIRHIARQSDNKKQGGRSGLGKYKKNEFDKFMEKYNNSNKLDEPGFMVVVNMLDFTGKEIKCENYLWGSPWTPFEEPVDNS